MIIQLSDDFRIRTDPYNWILERYAEVMDFKTGEPTGRYDWRLQGYYGSAEQAIKAIPDHLARSPEIKTLQALNAAMERQVAMMDHRRRMR